MIFSFNIIYSWLPISILALGIFMIRLNILIPSGYLSTTSPRTYNVSSDWRLICFISVCSETL